MRMSVCLHWIWDGSSRKIFTDEIYERVIAGAGNFGRVSIVEDGAGRRFACKSIPIKSKKQKIENIQREVAILHHLNGGRNTIHLHEVIEDKRHVHIIMELCSGGPLEIQETRSSASRKRKRMNKVVASKENEVKHLFWQIVIGVNYCHQLGVLHGDLKMDNILFLDDTKKSLKIVDFGVSKFFEPGGCGKEAPRGDLLCIAPEVAKRSSQIGPKADVWSAGVILYSLLSGVRPYEVEGSNNDDALRAIRESKFNDYNSKIWLNISKEGKELVSRMLKESPDERISLAEVLDHKWFKEAGISLDPTARESPIISRMRMFKQMTVFKRVILKMIAETLILEEETLGLRKVFKSLSTFKKNNEISFDRVKNGLRRWVGKYDSEEMDLLLDAMDLDGNKSIHRTEFVASTMPSNRIERPDYLEKAFHKFPLDMARSITKEGFKQALLEINISTLNMEEIIDGIYVDEDQKISFADFTALVK